jgi:arginyl-tRNA--protein-N-Asp/Glu arginylyltransferase
MKFCRIDLSKTNYNLLDSTRLLNSQDREDYYDILSDIYKQYCRYKRFESIMPLFKSEVIHNWVMAYYDNDQIVAFSILKYLDDSSVESVQFAWDYANPELRLGIRSIEHECAYFKQMGITHLYLGQNDEYKKKFDGYEELGNLYV